MNQRLDLYNPSQGQSNKKYYAVQSQQHLGYGRKAPMRERKITYNGADVMRVNNSFSSMQYFGHLPTDIMQTSMVSQDVMPLGEQD